MKDAPVEREVVVGRGDQIRGEEREADLVAGAVDDDVRRLFAPVGEDHGLRGQPCDVRLGRDVAVREPRQDRVADRRVRLERAVVGLGQAVALHRPDRGAQRRLHEALADRERHPRRGHELVQRAPEDVLGHDPGAAPRRQEHAVGRLRGLVRDVHRRVAHPEHDDALAGEQRGIVAEIVVRVHLDALEDVVALERGLGPARVPVVAVGHQQRSIRPLLAGLEPHPPALRGRLRVLDPGLERDPLAQAEVVDVGVEVGRDLRVVREVRIAGRHREVRVGHPVARGVDVQRAVGRRHPVGVAEDPVPAHAIGLLEAVERDSALRERLDRGDPRGPRADHTDGK